jgi:hypothetical protein
MIDMSDPRYTKKKKTAKTVTIPKPKKANKALAKQMKAGGRKSYG